MVSYLFQSCKGKRSKTQLDLEVQTAGLKLHFMRIEFYNLQGPWSLYYLKGQQILPQTKHGCPTFGNALGRNFKQFIFVHLFIKPQQSSSHPLARWSGILGRSPGEDGHRLPPGAGPSPARTGSGWPLAPAARSAPTGCSRWSHPDVDKQEWGEPVKNRKVPYYAKQLQLEKFFFSFFLIYELAAHHKTQAYD